ncbi:MAG: formate dehydrogenase accessory sulfurtransferase FdhD [Parvularculaceae bacterium]
MTAKAPAQAQAPGWRKCGIASADAAGRRKRAVWGVAEEEPVEIGFNGKPWVVMLASPMDLEDLARGLSFTEGVVEDVSRIESMDIRAHPEGWTVDIAIPDGALTDRARKFRTLEGRTGCGLCGVETLADAVRRPAGPIAPLTIDDAAILRAFSELKDWQPLNAATYSVHAAAWCAPNGEIRLAREDAGRHNALDKLIGALLMLEEKPGDGFIVMTSRCSMELVQKTAAFGAPLLATVSAPTGRALDLAAAAGLAIRCLGPDGGVVSFDQGE